MSTIKAKATFSAYAAARYWHLCELRRVRASLRVGNTTEPNARKERRGFQRELVNLRQYRKP